MKCVSGTYIGDKGYVSKLELTQLLADVVRVDSTFGREAECGRLLEKIALDNGLIVDIMPVTDDRFNVLITIGAEGYEDKKHGLILHGHYDTVPMLDMPDPLNPKITNNRMWGRGVVDQKSGLVAALGAAIAIKRSGRSLQKPFCVAAVVDEESEHRGSYALTQSKLQSDFAIVTEPTNTVTCEFGCRGTSPIRIEVEGLTAHASNPWVGINAIQKSMPLLDALFSLDFPQLDLGTLGSLRATLCVSMFEAGTAYNNVPGKAVIWLDRRTIPGENNSSALAQVQAIIDTIKKSDPDFKAIADVARPDWHWETIRKRGLNPTLVDPDAELFGVLNRAAEKVGIQLEKKVSLGYNDMDFLVNDMGIETLVYGPGDGKMAHTPYEEVDLDDVCKVAEVYCQMIEEICM